MASVRIPSARALGGTLLATWLLSCDGSTPTEETEECRNYPLSFEENGVPFTCELDPGGIVVLTCASGTLIRRWEYSSLGDFVREPGTPNRIRAANRTSTGGLLLASYTETLRSYEYDPRGRLSRRTRTTSGSLGDFVLDETRFTEWDASGRPIRGEIQAGEESEPVVLTYDDGRRLLETSTGERVSQDGNGNLLSEVEIFGLGPERFRSEREYRTTATGRACIP
jgi:YD repeat-containing protein